MASSKASPSLCLLFLGSGGVGKSSLVNRYLGREFQTRYNPTIEDFFSTSREINGCLYTVNVLDVAGQEEYQALVENTIGAADAVVIVYDVTREKTFDEIKPTYAKLQRLLFVSKPHVPIAIIGNKLDLAVDDPTNLAISETRLATYAQEHNAIFYTTSAVTNHNVDKAISALLSIAASRKPVPNNEHCCKIQ